MRAFSVLLLATAVLAQPRTDAPTTVGLLDAIGNAFSSTVDAVGNQLENYVETQGKSLLSSLFGQVLGQSFTSLLGNLFGNHETTTQAPSKRDISEVYQMFENVARDLQDAQRDASQLGDTIRFLLNALLGGTLSVDDYKAAIPKIDQEGKQLLTDLKNKLAEDILSVLGNHRRALDLTAISQFLQDLETQGQALFGQLTTALSAFGNPNNLLSLFGDLAQAVGGAGK